MTGERVVPRLVAILVADVVGYSRLMGPDENGLPLFRRKAHRILSSMRSIAGPLGFLSLIDVAVLPDAYRRAW